jgi:archaellin
MKLNKSGEMGVSAMIIFIAMVLVAAVAASVLISTANTVREQATQTGNDAIRGVSSGYDLEYVTGDVVDNHVTDLYIHIRTGAGSPTIDVSKLIVSMTVGASSWDMPCNDTNTVVTDERLTIHIYNISAAPGELLSIKLLPQYGYATGIVLRVPDILTPGTMVLR